MGKSAQPRIALFTAEFRHLYDGCSNTLFQITDHLERQKIPFRVLSPTFSKEWPYQLGQRQTITSIPFPLNHDYQLALPLKRRLFEALDQFEPNVVHVSSPCTVGHLGLSYAKSRGLPLVGIYHTHFFRYLKYYHITPLAPLAYFLGRRFYNHFDLLLVPTPSIKQDLQDIGITCPMRLWGRGIDVDFFNPQFRSNEWRSSVGATDQPIAFYAGRLVWEKGFKVFIETYRRLQRTHPQILWVIAGAGKIEKTLRKRLPNALFLGHLNKERLRVTYASSDLFVFPSDTETYGNVILEAMASGLPVITADAGGPADIVRAAYGSGECLFPPKNSEALAKKIDWLLHDELAHNRISKQSLTFTKTCRWDLLLGEIGSLYHHLAHCDPRAFLVEPPLREVEYNLSVPRNS